MVIRIFLIYYSWKFFCQICVQGRCLEYNLAWVVLLFHGNGRLDLNDIETV